MLNDAESLEGFRSALMISGAMTDLVTTKATCPRVCREANKTDLCTLKDRISLCMGGVKLVTAEFSLSSTHVNPKPFTKTPETIALTKTALSPREREDHMPRRSIFPKKTLIHCREPQAVDYSSDNKYRLCDMICCTKKKIKHT